MIHVWCVCLLYVVQKFMLLEMMDAKCVLNSYCEVLMTFTRLFINKDDYVCKTRCNEGNEYINILC
jgi:hypothetical protein